MNRPLGLLLALLVLLAITPGVAGKVVNENTDRLPPGCDEIRDEVELTVRGGREHAHAYPGAVFTFDNRSWEMEACTRVTITFVNDDDVRHQFMVHGAWPEGFFLIEVDGGEQDTGTFITGKEPKSLLIHCGVAQHQQKGMKGQILVAGGEGDIPNILGVSGIPGDAHSNGGLNAVSVGAHHAVLGLLLGAGVAFRRRRARNAGRQDKGAQQPSGER